MAETIKIGGELESTATGNVVAAASAIKDNTKDKYQDEINTETYSLVNNVNERLSSLNPEQQSALSVAAKATNNETKLGYYVCGTEGNASAKVISNATGYVLSTGGSIKVKMTNANTADNATLNINSTGAKPLYYDGVRASANNTWEAGETVEVYYDGTNFYANNVAGGGGDGVFDVSEKYPTSGVEGGNTYTLDGALAVLNANLPASKKKGGMSIKFVQSSDNKYVQARCMAQNFTTDVTQWQGIDDEPTAGSQNLIKSGGVAHHTRLLNSLNKTSVLNITGFGTTGTSGNALGIGDIYYNTSTKKLRRLIKTTPNQTYGDVGFDYAFYYNVSTGDFYYYDEINEELVLHNINGNEFDNAREVGVQITELYNGTLPNSNYKNEFVILEYGLIDYRGKLYYQNNRVRFSRPLHAPFILEVNDGYTITAANEYSKNDDGTLEFSIDKVVNSKIICFTKNAFKPVIKKDNSGNIDLSEFNQIVKSITYLPTQCIRINGFGSSYTEGGVSKIGDIYYNIDTKKLLCATNASLTLFEEYPVSDNTICLYNGEEYKYLENYGLISSTKDAIISSAINLDGLSSIQFEQGGLDMSGHVVNDNYSQRVRTPFYPFSRGVSVKLSNNILVKPFYYNNIGALINAGAYSGVLQELATPNISFVRFLFKKNDSSNLTPNDVSNAITFNGSGVPYIKRDNSIYEEVDFNKISFEQGAIAFINGEDTDDSYDYRIRTPYLRFTENTSKIEIQSVNTNFFIVFIYDENKNFVKHTGWTQIVSIELRGYIRIAVKKNISGIESFSPGDENILYKITLPANRVSNSSSVPELEQGGLTSFGTIDDTPGYAEKRVRTVDSIKCISLNLTLNDGYLVKLYVYGNKFYSTDYLSNISIAFNYNERIKLLFKKSDSSDVSVTDIEQNITECSIVYDKGAGEIIDHRIDKCVLLTEPMIGIPSVYASDTYQKVDIESKTSTELYAEYDNLVSSYPLVFKRLVDIGYDSDNNPIRAYELGFNERLAASGEGFNPNENIWSEIYNPKKIIITSGVHGDEKTASWGLMLAIKDIVESAEAWATYIKANFVIRIVPCVNVWGFNNMTRLDKDGNDINRDYGKWITPSGQSLKNFFNNNADAVYYLDVHGTMGPNCYYEVSRYSDWYYLHARTISKIRAALYSNWLQLYNTSSIISGYLSSSQNYGMLIQYCETELGIPSGITEIPRCYDGNDNVNYLSSCKLTKDMVINMIQMYGSSVVKYDKNKQ